MVYLLDRDFKSGDPKERAEAIVIATTNYNDPEKLIEVSKNLGEPMVGINIDDLDEAEKLAKEVGNENWCFSTSRFLLRSRTIFKIYESRLCIN